MTHSFESGTHKCFDSFISHGSLFVSRLASFSRYFWVRGSFSVGGTLGPDGFTQSNGCLFIYGSFEPLGLVNRHDSLRIHGTLVEDGSFVDCGFSKAMIRSHSTVLFEVMTHSRS